MGSTKARLVAQGRPSWWGSRWRCWPSSAGRWWQGRARKPALMRTSRYEQILAEFRRRPDRCGAARRSRSCTGIIPKSAYVITARSRRSASVFVSRNELDKAAPRLQRRVDTDPRRAVAAHRAPAACTRAVGRAKHDEALATLGTAGDMGAYAESHIARSARRCAAAYKGDRAGALREYRCAARC